MTKTGTDLFDLSGTFVLVAGASRGIGSAIAQGLADAGARVVAVGRSANPEKAFKGSVQYICADLGVNTKKIVATAVGNHCRLDCLVNSIGVSIPADNKCDELQRFRATIETNLDLIYALCLAALPFMTGGGSIINLTSVGSVLGFPDNPGYVSSKGAVRMLTKALAVDLGPKAIRVNSLAPGYIRTAMTARSYADEGENARRRAHTCLGRWGEPEDVVGAAIFLASDASRYVTGTDLFVDGGWTAKGLV
jgi:NAD(P)-dependent dehydrogenase (short-subunit alcohol dehydrogenase family)